MRRGRIARDWAVEIERICREIRAPDSHLRVQLAVEKLSRDALIWWKIAPIHYRVERFTWEDSIELFYRHHCTREYQEELEQIDLKKRRQEERIERLMRERKKKGTIRRANRQTKGMI